MFMTGTCTLESHLFGIKINFTYWPNHEQMRHCSVSIKSRYTGTPMNKIKKVWNATMKGPLATRLTKLLMYSNMQEKTIDIGKKVEEYLETDDVTFLIDVMTIHGRQTRTQKASYLDLFVSDQTTLARSYIMRYKWSCKCRDRQQTRPVCHQDQMSSINPRHLSRKGTCWAYSRSFSRWLCISVLLLRRTLNPDKKMTTSFRSMMISDHIKVAGSIVHINSFMFQSCLRTFII